MTCVRKILAIMHHFRIITRYISLHTQTNKCVELLKQFLYYQKNSTLKLNTEKVGYWRS